jgi:hypothetical protein
MLKRYEQAEVDAALAGTGRGVYTPHDQMVLAGEVSALREQYRVAMFCPEHAILMYVGARGTERQCWNCTEGKRLRGMVESLRLSLRVATDCPEALPDETGKLVCWYRSRKQAQVATLQLLATKMRDELTALRAQCRELVAENEALKDDGPL